MYEWICCCCGCCKVKTVKKDKKKKNPQKTAKVVVVKKKEVSKHKSNKVVNKLMSSASGPKSDDIKSFYGKQETNEKVSNSEEVKDSRTPSAIPEKELVHTYKLPYKDCHSVPALMKHLGYHFQSQVGKGGFGLVRKCFHIDEATGYKKVLACKEIILTKKEKMLKSLKSEIFVLLKCKHPYIISLEDHFIVETLDQSIAFLFMEFADCDTLSHEINNGPLSNSEAKRYFAQTISALAYLHKLKIAHKDLKPDNILLVRNHKTGLKDVRVGDFGLSQNVYIEKEGIIKSGGFGGTRGYMAPEILRHDVFREHRKILELKYDPFRSDMWALGVCLFEMLTKTLPFEQHNTTNMLSLEEESNFSYPRSVRDSIDPLADNLIRQLLEPDVAKRIDPLGVLTHPWIKDEVDLKLLDISEQNINS